MKRATRNGAAVLRDEIGEFTLYSPPIPVDRGAYLNGHITDPKRQLWSDPTTRPLLDGETRVPEYDGETRLWALPELPTDREFLKWPKWERERFQAREWDRRKNGVWFFNAGVPTWLPGIAYFYLTYYHLDVGLPVYREADRQFWWVWHHCLVSPNCYGLYYQTRRQQGKCLAPGTMVRMFDGTLRAIETVKVGDLVMGVDSTPRTVLSTHAGEDEMYEVVQNRGMPYTVNSEHLVSLRRNKSTRCSEMVNGERKYYQSYPQYGEVANVPAKELLGKSAKFFSQFSGYMTGYELPEKPVTIDPYFLGTWLGDGNAHTVGITTVDPETRDYVYEVARGYGLTVNVNQNSNKRCPTYIITTGVRGSRNNTLRNEFAAYNLFNNKHVPADYLQNSREVRLQVLAGLIDTDGYTNVGCYCITQKSKQLADDIFQLAVSLGFRVMRAVIKKQIRKIGFEGEYQKLTISGAVDEIPVRLPRKKLVLKSAKDKQLTRINEIRPVGRGQYFGFSLDGDHLFLLEDGTVVHNSYKLGCIALEAATRVGYFHAGLQSKTEADAKKLFQRAVVLAWKKLPLWFSPLYDGTTNPKEELLFQAPAKRGKEATADDGSRVRRDELNSRVDFASSVETAYDGTKLGFFGNDEVGKDQAADPMERWSVVKKMMNQAGRIIGKSLATTTSSQKDSDEGSNRRRNGLATAKAFWNESDHTALNADDPHDETKTGLFRLMQPAYLGHIVDTHGRDQIESSRAYYLRIRKRCEGDPAALLGEKRANPFDATEMLLPDGSRCAFDPAPIVAAIQAIEELPAPAARPYRLRWNPDKTAVTCEPHPDGRWLLVPEAIPRPDRQNRTERVSTLINTEGQLVDTWRPLQGAVYVLSTDPIDRDLSQLARLDQASTAAAHVGWKLDVENERDPSRADFWPSGGFIGEYGARPKTKDEYREDLIMACHFFGCRILPENSRGDIRPYFRRRGYAAFIDKPPRDMTAADAARREGGVNPTTASNHYRVNKLEHLVDEWLTKDWRYVPFLRTLNDMLNYDPDNTKKFDFASSASLNASALIPSAIRAAAPARPANVVRTLLGFAQ